VIESRRKELFCKFYPANGAAHEANMLTPDEIAAFLKNNPDTTVVGDREQHSATEVVTCALLASRADVNNPEHLPRPLYIRPPDVTISPRPQPQEQCA
ncbi:MAG TPA: hypothetical protein VFR09_01540, partial [Alphaproteobacteria bacterium]|nr:hypothetical protein [Alphaproteobacteria bacterium]